MGIKAKGKPVSSYSTKALQEGTFKGPDKTKVLNELVKRTK